MASLIAVLSGILMSVQGVFNTRLTEKSGIWFSNTIIHCIGLLTCLIILIFVRDADISGLKSVNKFYLLGGAIGVGIVYTVILSISKLGPAGATMLILIAQLVASYLIELFGLFGTEKVDFQWTKLLAVGVIAVGIVLFQWKK